jgi:hypothetical protein
MLNLSGIEQMIILREGFERIKLQLCNIENNTMIFFNFKYLNLICH